MLIMNAHAITDKASKRERPTGYSGEWLEMYLSARESTPWETRSTAESTKAAVTALELLMITAINLMKSNNQFTAHEALIANLYEKLVDGAFSLFSVCRSDSFRTDICVQVDVSFSLMVDLGWGIIKEATKL
jgi:hypothetical protein